MGRVTSNLAKDIGMTMWMVMNTTCPSLRFLVSSEMINVAKTVCRKKLKSLPSGCLEYDGLLERKYMKEKHWVYAVLMATMESLPLLYQKCTREEILQSVLAKTYLGTSSKLLDNLNDEIHTVNEALDSLENYLTALTAGEYERKEGSLVEMAESSACEMASWIFECLDYDAPAFNLYKNDCITLVQGQISSLEHKSTEWPSLDDYCRTIAEKSIGDVWIDVDLCHFDEMDEDLCLLKKGNEYIFKSSLVYDDVQDIVEDIQTTSVNSAVILALERGVITEEDLERGEPKDIVKVLDQSGILEDIIHLADAFFLKGVFTFLEMETACVDKKGLLQSFRLVRLFNLRKLFMMKRDVKTFRKVLESFSDFQSLQMQIPEEMSNLVS
jgi:hypothetical protein